MSAIPAKNEVMKSFAAAVARWMVAQPGRCGEIRAAVCSRLSLREGEFDAWLSQDAGFHPIAAGASGAIEDSRGDASATTASLDQAAATGRENAHWPGQPAPLGPPAAGDSKRPELANFHWESRWTPSEGGETAVSRGEVAAGDLARFKMLAKRESRARRLRERDEGINAQEAKAAERENRAVRSNVIVNAAAGAYQDLSAEDAQWFKDFCEEVYEKKPFAVLKPVMVMKGAAEIRAEIVEILHGWPMLLSGAWLFVDDERWKQGIEDERPYRLIEDATQFKGFLHDYFHLKFLRGNDVDKANYVDFETLFSAMLATSRNWQTVERHPHCPALPGHYYAWAPPADYVADGSHLAKMLMYFDNVQDLVSRSIFAAGILTVYSGIPYGRRPAIIFEAKNVGSGKSTCANSIAQLVGGSLNIDLDHYGLEKMMERLLSPDGMDKRVVLLDNVTVTLRSPKLDQLITNQVHSGKRLGIGEGRRPNSLCTLVTMNNAKVDVNFARRSFFVQCLAPKKDVSERVKWDLDLTAFIKTNRERIAADALAILGAVEVEVDWGALTQETFAPWAREVLARAMSHPAIKAAIWAGPGVGEQEEKTVKDVLADTQARRDERNEEIEEARTFVVGLYECVQAWKKYERLSLTNPKFPDKNSEIFIRTSPPPESTDADGNVIKEEANYNMVSFWKRIFAKNAISAKWVTQTIEEHIDGGRIRGLRRGKDKAGASRGFWLDSSMIIEWLKVKYEQEENAEREKDASNVSEVSSETNG